MNLSVLMYTRLVLPCLTAALLIGGPLRAEEVIGWEIGRMHYSEKADQACEGDPIAYAELVNAAYKETDAIAQNALRWVYLTKHCKYAQEGYEGANELLLASAAQEYPLAMSNLGAAYLLGIDGFEKDPRQGRKLLEGALDLGYKTAGLILAEQLIIGENIGRDLELATKVLVKVGPHGTYGVPDQPRFLIAWGNLFEAIPDANREDLEKATVAYVAALPNPKAADLLAAVLERKSGLPFENDMKYGALAVSGKDGIATLAVDEADSAAAAKAALRDCSFFGSGCRTVLLFRGQGCVAFLSGNGGWPYGFEAGRKLAEAETAAGEECARGNDGVACTGHSKSGCNTGQDGEFQVLFEAVNNSVLRRASE